MNPSGAESRRGLFLVLEGIDGSGKTTQFKRLAERLEQEGYPTAIFDFPQYEQPSSHFVREYLNGHYGSVEDVGPYVASLFYALDRYEAASKIREALDQGKVVLANRFTGSNMAHQGTKFGSAEERRGYFVWLDNLEFDLLGIPRPDKCLVLRVPAETAQQLIDEKEVRSYTDKKRDIHEADLHHLQKTVEVYDDLCQLFPKEFTRIDCVRGGQLLSIDDVQDYIWKTLQPHLPPRSTFSAAVEPKNKPTEALARATTPKEATMRAIKLPKPDNSLVIKTETGYEMTDEGKAFLEEAVSSTTDTVYAFNDKLSPITVAAAMARLSRRSDDMRITILDEFANALGKDEQLLKRVITAYGDDSVQQLAGVHVVVEQASNLLTKKLEWGRLAAYLEQSTRYIYFDQKDKHGQYRYHTPNHFDQTTKATYQATMDQIFDLYSDLVRNLTTYIRKTSTTPIKERDAAWHSATKAQACDAVRPLLPVATTATVGIYASGQALESLIMHLLSDELPEARKTGQKILDAARTVIPTFLERADKPERGGAGIAYRANTHKAVKKLAEAYLPDNHSATSSAVKLLSVWPHNELDLIPDMLYEHSNLPLEQIAKEVADWPIER